MNSFLIHQVETNTRLVRWFYF